MEGYWGVPTQSSFLSRNGGGELVAGGLLEAAALLVPMLKQDIRTDGLLLLQLP